MKKSLQSLNQTLCVAYCQKSPIPQASFARSRRFSTPRNCHLMFPTKETQTKLHKKNLNIKVILFTSFPRLPFPACLSSISRLCSSQLPLTQKSAWRWQKKVLRGEGLSKEPRFCTRSYSFYYRMPSNGQM